MSTEKEQTNGEQIAESVTSTQFSAEEASEELGKENTENAVQKAWRILRADKSTTRVVFIVAPAVRVAIGERFAFARGEDALCQLAEALRGIGADFVADGAFAADMAVNAVAEELRARLESGDLPLVTGSPAFVAKAKEKYPALAGKLIPVAPALTLAEKIRSAFARLDDGKRTEIIVVAPCAGHGNPCCLENGVLRLTTRQLAVMLESACVNLRRVRKGAVNKPFDTYTGAGVLSAVPGGLAEGVARQLAADKTEESYKKLQYSGLRGRKPVREAEIGLETGKTKFAVVCGRENVFSMLEKISDGTSGYALVETACRTGGCLLGDGQPEADESTEKLRVAGIYRLDAVNPLKTANANLAALKDEFSAEELEWTDLPVIAEPVEEAIEEVEPVEEVTEEVEPVEETIEEVEPVEETIEEVIETVDDDSPIEELFAEDTETELAVTEDPAEETVEEVLAEEPAEESVETPVGEPAEETTETSVGESAEEAEEIEIGAVEEFVGNSDEEGSEEGETDGETGKKSGEKEVYYRSLSRKDRRKIARMNKFKKNHKK